MAIEQNMTQAIKANKAVIKVKEADNPVNSVRPVHTMLIVGGPVLRQPA